MSLSKLSVERPVLASVFSLAIILVGLVSIFKLPVREYPDIDAPVVTITTVYYGANSQVIESEVTDIIEEELGGVEGVKSISSSSKDQVSVIAVEFNLDKDLDSAAQDVREKVSRAQNRLPDNSEVPIIAKADADSQPIIWIKVRSRDWDLLKLSEYVDRYLKDSFQTIPGVSKVIKGGDKQKSVQIIIDPKKLDYYNITILDIASILENNSIELPGGTILTEKQELSVKVNAKLKTIQDFEQMVIKNTNTGIITLKSVAKVQYGARSDNSFVRFNGEQGFGLGIVRQSKSNTIEISNRVEKKLNELKTKVPPEVVLEKSFDQSTFIRFSLEDLFSTILFSSSLVILIIFLFLRNFRATLIPALAIPISLIGVLAGLNIMGFTINLMTLLGLIIAVGIVVDDSIVVLENIYRYIEEGMDSKEAAIRGCKEITTAVIATTLVLVAIFLPVGFMSGISGRVLSEFAFSLCFATIISSFVALTMTPMTCYLVFKNYKQQLLNKDKKDTTLTRAKNYLYTKLESIFVLLENNYEKILPKALKVSNLIVYTSIFFSLFIIWFSFTNAPQDFIPDEDRGSFITIVQTRRGSNIDFTDRVIRQAENTITALVPEQATAISIAAFGRDAPGSVTDGIIINRLVDWDKRQRHVSSIIGPLYPALGQITDAFVLPVRPKSGPSNGFGALPVQVVIKSNDLEFLNQFAEKITAQASTLPSVMFAKSNLSFDKPELDVEINRFKARQLGISLIDISKTLEIFFTGVDLTDFNIDGENYEVIARVSREDKSKVQKLSEVSIRNNMGQLIQLSNVIDIKPSIGAEELSHYDRRRSVTIEAAQKPGKTPGDALTEVEKLIRETAEREKDTLPNDFEIDFKGTSKELKDSNGAIYISFIIAILFAYLFLAGQFESFKNPIVILLTVPLAIAGGMVGILIFQLIPLFTQLAINFGAPPFIQYIIPQFTNISLNLYSQVGLIMLIGMASKNGILMVEFIDQLVKQGQPIHEAVIEASKLRLRPILMTAFSTILGIVPVALALGIGSESRQSMGIVIITGMAASTFLTLFVIPAAYLIFNNKK